MYLIPFSFFIILNADCALAPNIASLATLGFLYDMAGSAGAGLGTGVASDVFAAEVRGKTQAYMSWAPNRDQ